MDRADLNGRHDIGSADGSNETETMAEAFGPPIGRHAPPGGRILAVLGPTNTGKTFFAMERMLAHKTGMIGFPLRLLARENYDRAVTLKGADKVALITGEEKIAPPNAQYWICTVEAMPLDLAVDFLAVDEIQMASDPERGRVFTERLLNARGQTETVFLGAETARTLVCALAPRVEVLTRPRLSQLTYSGYRKISRLPRRSAVVAFSISEVYRLAELARRQRGGAAVVMGALSPRARNAQVAMYQAGEVDYLIATDAIGMGLNMDVSHVAFAGLSKFDGQRPRRLLPSEIGQIAGRAGRSMRDGTFGPTGELGAFDPDVIERVEEHRFQTLKRFYWRNEKLNFNTAAALKQSLEQPPPSRLLARGREGDDVQALAALMRDDDVAAKAKGRNAVSMLWDVCQIPDFRKTLTDSHARLLSEIYLRLLAHDRLDPMWAETHIERLDRPDGDIDLLMARIANVRVWTYISHRAGWLDATHGFQERARSIEDSLSDALHERLTQRFVDRRSATLVRKLADGSEFLGGVDDDGVVVVEGDAVGRLTGFRFVADGFGDFAEDKRAIENAAARVITAAIPARVARFLEAPDDALTLDDEGRLQWEGGAIARLKAGRQLRLPEIDLLAADALEGRHRDDVEARCARWLAAWLARALAPLDKLAALELSPPARGLAFQLIEALGFVARGEASQQIDGLTKADRKALADAGFRVGRFAIWAPVLMRGRALKARRLLWRLNGGVDFQPSKRALALTKPKDVGEFSALALHGFVAIGPQMIRAEAAERLAATAYARAAKGPFPVDDALAATVKLTATEMPQVLDAIGFRAVKQAEGETLYRRGPYRDKTKKPNATKPKRKPKPPQKLPPIQKDSPFAALKALTLG